MPDKIDYKKEYKDLYMPKQKPAVIEVPAIPFIMINGKGNPNDESGEYSKAIELLYALCYTIKMSKMGENKPDGYFEYVVPPLEGLWWLSDGRPGVDYNHKDKFFWTSMIRQPEFVTQEVFEWACREVQKKKGLDTSKARLEIFEEGICVQCMHVGAYDDEPATIAKMDAHIEEQGLINDVGEKRRHHEIYLGDPRKVEISKMKTVIRIPVKRQNIKTM